MQGRATPAANNPSSASNDPLAELARLIGQSDPFGEYGRPGTARQVAAAQVPEPAIPGYGAKAPQQAPYPPHAPDPHTASAPPVNYVAEAMARQQPYGGNAPLHADDQHQAPQGPVPGYENYGDHAAGAEAYDDAAYDPNTAYGGEDDGYYDDVPPTRRRMSVLAVAAVFALAVVGTAGAFGYRALFGSVASGPPPVIKADANPAKIMPKAKDQSAKLINDRLNDPANQKLVSREEQPVDLNKPKAVGVLTEAQPVATASGGDMQAPGLGSGVIGADPKKIHTITIRPDQPGMANVASAAPATADVADTQSAQAPLQPAPSQASEPAPEAAPTPAVTHVAHEAAPKPAPAPRHVAAHHPAPEPHRVASAASNAPLSLTPDAVAPTPAAVHAPARLAPRSSHEATVAGGHYAVQISSRRNQSDAQAALNRMKSQYSSVIGGEQAMVRRVDLGAKGVYYRAMVGPFGSSEQANRVCSRLKAAGGSCFVQKI